MVKDASNKVIIYYGMKTLGVDGGGSVYRLIVLKL